MQVRTRLAALILVPLCLLGPLSPAARASEARRLVYRITTGSEVAQTSELFAPRPSGYAVLADTRRADLEQTQSFELDPRFVSYTWTRRNAREGTDFTAVRHGNVIRLTGFFKSQRVNREYRIDDRPWKQCFPVDLQKWAASPDKTLTFWAINPLDLEIHTFRVKKQDRETITVNGQPVETVRVRIAPTGLLSFLWHCNVWFRASDGRFVRFEGASGPPGSPMTVTELVSEEEIDG